MKKILLMLVTSICLSGCIKNNIYTKFDKDFDDNRWAKADIKTYDFTIDDASKTYDLILDFSHVAGFQFSQVPIKIEITNPDQTKTEETIVLAIKDIEGNDAGDCGGDYCDLSHVVFENKKLAAGKYGVKIINEFNNVYLPNVIGVGIKVNLSEK